MNKNLGTYLDLCTQVYDLSKPTAPSDAYSFYLSYAQEADGPILEPMCGTGRFLLPLLAEGFDVEGFDASSSMLKALADKAKLENLHPKVWHGFVEDLSQPKRYKLIFIPSGSFGLITDLCAVRKALQIIYEHLAQGGLYVFEVETSLAVPKELGIWRGSRWQRADGSVILLSQLATLDNDLCYSIGKYEVLDHNQIQQTEIEEYKIRLYSDPANLIDLLKDTGFTDVRLVKAFARTSSVEEGDDTIVFECRK